MAYESTFYSSPEKYGLISFGSIDFAGSWEFDITAVFRRVSDGAFFYASDSGCSCPVPFENAALEDLQPLESLYEFQQYLKTRRDADDRQDDIVRLLERLHEAGCR